jgi:hypothetical protein
VSIEVRDMMSSAQPTVRQRSSAVRTGMLLVSLVAMAGCGGGGGGGGGSSVVLPTPGPAPSVPFQAPNATVTYSVDVASAYVINQSVASTRLVPAGGDINNLPSYITITTNSSGSMSQISFAIQAPGGYFSSTYTDISSFPPLTLNQLANLLQVVNTTVGADGFIGEGPGLSYSAYGLWASNDTATSGRFGAVALGSQTPLGSMPVSGTGTYQGSTLGAGIDGAGPYALRGNVTMSVNFGTGAASTTMSGIQRQHLVTNNVSVGADLTGTGTVSGNRVTTTLAGGGSSGGLHGTFYGPSAQEVAGAWRVTGGGNTTVGSFGAKR